MRAESDTGPLIRLSWIDRLDLLDELFDELLIPVGVWRELVPPGAPLPGVEAIVAARARGWFTVRAVRDDAEVTALRGGLDQGEAEAIILMRETSADLLLVDDRRARDEAARRGLPHTGTVGLLRLARDRGLIDAAYPILLELRQRNFWISAALLERIADEER